MSAAPVLRVALSAGYGKDTVLHDVRFDLHAGEALGFVGSSGAGKSTLALAALGLLGWRGGWSRGEVLLNGQNLLAVPERAARQLRGRAIALVPQSPAAALNAAVSLRSHLRAAWSAHADSGNAGLDARLRDLLPGLQLPSTREFLDRRPGAISVGQAQRVLVAMALLHRPAVLVADEPTSALDPVNQAELLTLLSRTCQMEGASLLYISHDLLSVLQLCSSLAVLHRGTLAEQVSTASLREGPASERPHGPALRQLLDSLPVLPQHVRPLSAPTPFPVVTADDPPKVSEQMQLAAPRESLT